MRIFGLIGYPLSHSFSQAYFTEKFQREDIENAKYCNFEIGDIRDFPSLLESNRGLCGLNVTIPYKRAVIPFLDALDHPAKAIGAVNTIHFADGKKTGYNTDWIGFQQSLKQHLKPHHKRALILGSGGASLAVQYALKQMNIAFQVVSRTTNSENFCYKDLNDEIIGSHALIVNTTPLGMEPRTDEMPSVPLNAIGSEHLVFDLVYNPPQTRFMVEVSRRGAATLNGYEMLVAQAEEAWKIWRSSVNP